MQVNIEINEQQAQVAAKNIQFLENVDNRKTVIEAADSALVVSLRKHFSEREKEHHVVGWWNRGLVYPKRYFWRGTRGTSVAEKIRTTLVSPQRLEAIVSIDSPALKHKLSPNPSPIRPKGGRKFLAIPASPQAAQWTGMPRDFPARLRFERWRRPDGSWISALIARAPFLTKGGRLAKGDQKRRGGQGQVVYWLVHQVRTRHDPNALPSNSTMQSAVNVAVATAIRKLTSGKTRP